MKRQQRTSLKFDPEHGTPRRTRTLHPQGHHLSQLDRLEGCHRPRAPQAAKGENHLLPGLTRARNPRKVIPWHHCQLRSMRSLEAEVEGWRMRMGIIQLIKATTSAEQAVLTSRDYRCSRPLRSPKLSLRPYYSSSKAFEGSSLLCHKFMHRSRIAWSLPRWIACLRSSPKCWPARTML